MVLFLRVRVVNDEVNQCKGAATANFAAYLAFENLVVNGGKKLFDVTFQYIRILAAVLSVAIRGRMGAFVRTVGISVGDHAALQNGGDKVAERMVYYSVAVGRGADHARFRVENMETAVGARAVAAGFQVLKKLEKVRLQVYVEAGDIGLEALSALSLASSQQQVLEIDN